MIEIIKGSTKTVRVQILDKKTGKPLAINGFLSATAFFLAADQLVGRVAATGTLVSADCAELDFPLTKPQTEALAAVDPGDFEVEVVTTAEDIIAQIIGKIRVLDRLFTGDSSCS
jgi:hypothetical protein